MAPPGGCPIPKVLGQTAGTVGTLPLESERWELPGVCRVPVPGPEGGSWQPRVVQQGQGRWGGSEVTHSASQGRAQEASAPGAPPTPGAAALALKRGSPEHRYYSYCRAEGNRQRDI